LILTDKGLSVFVYDLCLLL